MKNQTEINTQTHRSTPKFWDKIVGKFGGCSQIVWTDEKRFLLDGPDAYNFVWCEIDRKSEPELSKVDSYGKRGVMVHIAFSTNEILSCERIHGMFD